MFYMKNTTLQIGDKVLYRTVIQPSPSDPSDATSAPPRSIELQRGTVRHVVAPYNTLTSQPLHCQPPTTDGAG